MHIFWNRFHNTEKKALHGTLTEEDTDISNTINIFLKNGFGSNFVFSY